MTTRNTTWANQSNARAGVPAAGAGATRETPALATIRTRTAAYPPTRRTRPIPPSPADPRRRRASSGSPASTATAVTTSILATAVANPAGEPDQVAQTAAAAATANSSKPTVLRTISTSQAITRTPPASQASRLGPDGTSRASAQIA